MWNIQSKASHKHFNEIHILSRKSFVILALTFYITLINWVTGCVKWHQAYNAQEIKYENGLDTNKTRDTSHLLPSENKLKEMPCNNYYIKGGNVELENWPSNYYTFKTIPLRLPVYLSENVFNDAPNTFNYSKFALQIF
jgi:hypothetical protein